MEEYTLREIKQARTKIAIMNAFVKRMEKTRFDDISIREICKSVEISEGTFFNYFSEKLDIVNYYLHLLFLKVVWKARREVPQGEYLVLIESVFKNAAAELNNVNIMYQLISVIIMQQEKSKEIAISNIEKHFAFPDCDGIEDIPTLFIDRFFEKCLKEARKNGTLPPKITPADALVSLMTILGGTLLASKFTDVKDRAYHLMRQLHFFWQGLGINLRQTKVSIL